MPKFVVALSELDITNLTSHANFVEKISSQDLIRSWIYRYTYPDTYVTDKIQQVIDVEPDILRAVDKITVAYNQIHGHTNTRIGRFASHDFNAWKIGDTYNALLRRAIEDMIAKGDREP